MDPLPKRCWIVHLDGLKCQRENQQALIHQLLGMCPQVFHLGIPNPPKEWLSQVSKIKFLPKRFV